MQTRRSLSAMVPPRVPRALCALALVAAMTGPADAATFGVPKSPAAFTLTLPGSWHPNQSAEGVDAAAPDRTAFIMAFVSSMPTAEASLDEILQILARNGNRVDLTSQTESRLAIPAAPAREFDFEALDQGKPAHVTIDIAPLPGGKFAQVTRWGTPEGMARHRKALSEMVMTLKLKAGAK